LPTWKKWLLIGSSAGATIAILSAVCIGAFVCYSSRPVLWDDGALTVSWSEATGPWQSADDLSPLAAPAAKAEAERNLWPNPIYFGLDYGLHNNTSRDITIPAEVVIMSRLIRGKTLTDNLHITKTRQSYFIPAKQTAIFSVIVPFGCSDRQHPSEICYKEAFGSSENIVVFDRSQRLQITLPIPELK
jgi:hypothetical protein